MLDSMASYTPHRKPKNAVSNTFPSSVLLKGHAIFQGQCRFNEFALVPRLRSDVWDLLAPCPGRPWARSLLSTPRASITMGFPKGVGKKQPRPINGFCSVSSLSSNTSDATSARWYETFSTRVASSQSTFRPRKNAGNTLPVSEKSRRSRGDRTVGRETHRCPRSECRNNGLHCFAQYSRDARDAGCSLVGRKHDRVRTRTTSKYPTTGQGLVDAVAGDQSTATSIPALRPTANAER